MSSFVGAPPPGGAEAGDGVTLRPRLHPANSPVTRVSIIVLNYNYARFVGAAVESALAQTWPGCEVIVVDNGSTDDSLQVLQSYHDRVQLVRQGHNIGQGQGYNLGFEAARGEWLVWLDADDLLDPDAVAACMALARADTAKVQFPLRVIDSNGRSLGSAVPHLRHDGDVVPLIRRFGHYAGPPGSGNLYRRSAIGACFPVPVEQWPICTDTVPFLAAPFHGQVVDAGRTLGSYRLHGKAGAVTGYTGNFSTHMGREVQLNQQARDRALALLAERCGIVVPGPFLTLPAHVRNRIVSWRLGREDHPYPTDSAASLRRMMGEALSARCGYGVGERLLLAAWTLGVLHLPQPLARRLAGVTRSTPLGEALFRFMRRAGAGAGPALEAHTPAERT